MTHRDAQHAMSILVVEDESITAKLIRSVLETEGYKTATVSDGQACLDYAARLKPDVILMDVNMPGLDGIDTCRMLKSDDDLSHIPVIFVTASTNDETLEAAFKAGGRDYIRKPINRAELLSRLRLVRELQRSHEKDVEAQRLKGVLETAGGVCHKLNQPLQYLLGSVQILMMEMGPEEKWYPQMDVLREKIEQMGQITRKLAEITRYRTKSHAGGQHILDIDGSTDSDTTEERS